MTDDYLADFERELHAAAQRRSARSRAPRRRLLVPVVAVATAVAAAAMVLTLAGPAEREVEVPASPGDTMSLPVLEPSGACAAREGTVQDTVVHRRMGIFRRSQHAPDAPGSHEVQRLPAGDYDGRAMRSPTGIGVRILLAPTHAAGCTDDAGPGVCVIAGGSRCFTLDEIEAGRAVVLLEPGRVVGLAPDGVEAVVVEAGTGRVQTSVVENAFLAEIPGAGAATPVRVTLRGEQAGCAPSAEMLAAVPALDRPAANGGVPPAIRRSFGRDSAVIGRHARIWGGGDGVTYWVVPRLRCDGADADEVCVVPLLEDDRDADGGGGSACATPDEMAAGAVIQFPLGPSGSAAAGLAPPGTTEVRVRETGQRLLVEDGVWGGTLERAEPGADVAIEYLGAENGTPAVAVFNGTTITGLAISVMDALTAVDYSRAENGVGDWSEHVVERTVVYADEPWLGERIAIYLGESFDIARPEVRAMTGEARELAPRADAVVVAGGDLAP